MSALARIILMIGLAGAGAPSPAQSPTDAPPSTPALETPETPAAETPVPVPAPQIDPALIEAALARLPPSPSLEATQRAALRLAQLDPARGARWLRRARIAAALPTISLQYDHRLDRGWVLDREAGQADALRDDAGSQGVVRAKASWELDRLIFSPDELRAARAALDLADARERLLVEITRLYFERQRLVLERELAPATQIDAAMAAALRLREVEGLLEGLTGLEFGPSASR